MPWPGMNFEQRASRIRLEHRIPSSARELPPRISGEIQRIHTNFTWQAELICSSLVPLTMC
jgi:hypothetical protein